jgi:hypothetical protein
MHASSLAGRSQSATLNVISMILGAFDPRQFSPNRAAFHGDPHAGNSLFTRDRRLV